MANKTRADQDLLCAFLQNADESAFSEIVGRHGPMVYRVCFRILADHHESEDAAQAVFAVLVKKAGSIRKRRSLGSWLHGVARQTALYALRKRVSRRKREEDVAMTNAILASGRDGEGYEKFRGELDEALSRLSARQREAVVLRHLEGRSVSEACVLAGCSEDAMKSLTRHGVAKLRRLFGLQGHTVTGMMIIAVLETEARAAIPQTLIPSVMTASQSVAAGAATGAVSSSVLSLAEGVMKMMMRKQVFAAGLVGAATLVAGGIMVLAQGGSNRPVLRDSGTTPNHGGAWVPDSHLVPEKRVASIDGGLYSDRRNQWSVAYSPNAKLVAEAGGDHDVLLWDMAKRQVKNRLTGHTAGVRHVTFSPDGRLIATTSDDHTARIWEPATAKCLAVLQGGKQHVGRAMFSPDGTRLLTISATRIRLWAARSGAEEKAFSGHWTGAPHQPCAFSPDGSALVILKRPAEMWDLDPLRPRLVISGNRTGSCVAFSADGATIAIGGSDAALRLYRSKDGTERLAIRPKRQGGGSPGNVWAIAFAPDGNTIAVALDDSPLQMYDAQSGRHLTDLDDSFGPDALCMPPKFSPDSSFLDAVSRRYEGAVWDVKTGDVAWGEKDVSWLSFSPIGDRIAVARAVSGLPVQIWRRMLHTSR